MKKIVEWKKMNLIFKSFLLLSALISFSNKSIANTLNLGWNSSGGETIKDGRNPWFFSNTKAIKYCVLVDEELFGQSQKQVRPRVEKAINIWKNQLKDLHYRQELKLDGKAFQLGTQNFIETTCQFINGEVQKFDADLVFQFGVLSSEQFQYLKTPSNFLGVTIRTEYDKVNLKGSGFIYFSPEKGPLSFNKLGLIQNPWSAAHGALLIPAILHELGHVFGVQHSKSFPLMNETFIENLMVSQQFGYLEKWLVKMEQENLWYQYRFFKWEPSLWTPDFLECYYHQFSWNQKEENFYQFFGIDTADKNKSTELCFFMYKNNNEYTFNAYGAFNEDHPQIIGTAKLERLDVDEDHEDLIDVWLPKEQKVFITDDIIQNSIETAINIASF